MPLGSPGSFAFLSKSMPSLNPGASVSREAFEQAWTTGTGMTLAEAVLLALEEPLGERDLAARTMERSDPGRAGE